MKNLVKTTRWVAPLVVAALALATMAPLAEAGPGNGKGNGKGRGKDKGDRGKVESRERGGRSWSDYHGRRTERRGDYRVERRGDDRVERRGDYRSRPRYVDRSRDRVIVRDRTVVRSSPRYVYRSSPRYVYRSSPRYYSSSPYGSYTVWRRSSSGPVFAGFIGGLFVGATLANVAPAGFGYWDPYCHRGFISLGAYYSHCHSHHHATTVHVVEIEDGYGWDDYHYCDDCDHTYWGDDHDCD